MPTALFLATLVSVLLAASWMWIGGRVWVKWLVTTADLKVASFDVTHLSVADGTLREAEVVDVPFVRVRKQSSMRPANLSPADWLRHDDPDYQFRHPGMGGNTAKKRKHSNS